jgi:hypothetical protein
MVEPMTVRRIDAGGLSKPVKQANGWLRVDGYLTRTGVFAYGMPDGTVRREYRPPDEVFKADTLASFELVPVTDAHPPEFLTADNTTKYQRGAVSAPKVDGDKVRGTLLVTDAALVAKLEGNEARQVSCGYLCDLEDAQGVTAEGLRYDAIQRNIRGNHVAIVPIGRAGPEVRVRMDAAEALEAQPQESHMHNIRIDGITYEVTTPQAVQAFEKSEKAHADAVAALEKAVASSKALAEANEAKLDAAREETKKALAELKELPTKVRADMAARTELETRARTVLGAEAKLDAMSPADVRKAVLAKLSPELKLDGKSEAYVEARFDAALESAAKEDGWKADAEKLDTTEKADGFPPKEADPEAAKKAFMKKSQDAWKQPLSSAKACS